MTTGAGTSHKHTVSGKQTSTEAAHTHPTIAIDAALADLARRVTALEHPQPPVQVPSGPLQFTADNQVIENVIIDVAPGQPMTLALQTAPWPNNGIYGKGFKGCTLRNVTLRGREWGALLLDMDDLTLDNVTALDANYCGIAIFGGARGKIINSTAKRIGMLRTDFSDPGQQNNAYGFKFEDGAAGGGVSGAPSDWLVANCLVEDVPLWQGFNAHDGIRMTFQDNIARRMPRGYFFAGDVSQFTIARNQALECVTKVGGSQDKKGILIYQMQGATIIDNKVSSSYQPPAGVYFDLGGSTGITASGNTVIP